MGLSKEEKEQLEALTRKAKEPDAPPANIRYDLSLSDDKAWERATKLGLIPNFDQKDNDDEEEDEADDKPKRRGFFGDE